MATMGRGARTAAARDPECRGHHCRRCGRGFRPPAWRLGWCYSGRMRALVFLIAFIGLAWAAYAAERKPTRIYNGAIAYHRDSASFGYAVNRNTAREAQVEALKQCGHANCEVVAKLRNNCGVVVNG